MFKLKIMLLIKGFIIINGILMKLTNVFKELCINVYIIFSKFYSISKIFM